MMKRNFFHLLCIALFSFGFHIKTQAQCTVQIYETPGDSLNLPAIFAIAIDPNDSNAVFSYVWSTGDTTETIYNPIANAAYCVTVMGGGCTATACDTAAGCYLQANPNPTVALYGSAGSTFTYSLGSNVTGGTQPYTYQWTADPNISDLTIPNPMATITESICFTLKVTDVNGCFAYENNCFSVIDTTFTGCTASITEYSDSLGNTSLIASPYDALNMYLWSDGSTSDLLSNPIAGNTYCVTITFSDGCIASACYFLDSAFTNPCQVNIIPSGPLGNQLVAQPNTMGNYTFFWNTGETTQLIDVLNSGIYCVTITDSISGCSSSNCFVWDTTSSSSCAAAFITYYDQNYPNDVFLVNTTQGNNLSYFWDFGDGNTHTDSFPTHTYANNGYYNVCLTVTSLDSNVSCTSTFCDSVGISQALAGKTTAGFTLHVIKNINEVTVQEIASVAFLQVYPNPANEALFIELNSTQTASAELQVIDLMGRVIKTQNLAVQNGFNQINLDLLDLEQGIYFLNYTQNNESKTLRFLKN